MEFELTQEEKDFCELFANGSHPYAGNPVASYELAFNTSKEIAQSAGKQLIQQPHINKHIISISKEMDDLEVGYLKKRLTETLLHIMDETATSEYYDRRGTKLSPAALRSVSVQASKALMDMYPIKEANVNKLDISGSEGGITFNVVVPNKTDNKNE